MKMRCEGFNEGCEKVWSDDESQWHHNLGLKKGGIDGDMDKEGNPKLDYAKMCQECFEKLPKEKQSDWPLI